MTVVLLHAFPLDSLIWKLQADALSDQFEIIVPDLRGFGSAYKQLGKMEEISIDLAADDLVQLLDERGIDQAVIGGISRGGYIALSFARRHPQRLRALMLFDTRATPADEKEKQWYLQMVERLATEPVDFVPEIMKPRMFGPTAFSQKQDVIKQVVEIMQSQKPDAIRAAAKGMINRKDARPGLAQLEIPVLAVAGTEDGAFEDTRAIANAIRGAEFVAIENAGHLSIMEQPDLVIAEMRRFLNRVI